MPGRTRGEWFVSFLLFYLYFQGVHDSFLVGLFRLFWFAYSFISTEFMFSFLGERTASF